MAKKYGVSERTLWKQLQQRKYHNRSKNKWGDEESDSLKDLIVKNGGMNPTLSPLSILNNISLPEPVKKENQEEPKKAEDIAIAVQTVEEIPVVSEKSVTDKKSEEVKSMLTKKETLEVKPVMYVSPVTAEKEEKDFADAPAFCTDVPIKEPLGKEPVKTETEPVKTDSTVTNEKYEPVLPNPFVDTPNGKRALYTGHFNPPTHASTDITDLVHALRTIKQYMSDTSKELDYLYNAIHDCDYETNDLLHEIELCEKTEEEKLVCFAKMQELRQRRRSYKTRQNYFNEIKIFMKNNMYLEPKINALIYKLEDLMRKQESSVFFPRVRTDIKENEHIQYYRDGKGETDGNN